MNLRYIRFSLLVALLATGLSVVPASAQIDLRFTPADMTMDWGDSARLSVMLDDAIAIRTVDLTVSFDTTRVVSVSGDQGSLFSSSGVSIYDGFEEIATGTWHGYAIVMSATDSLIGPGELFTWDFTAVGGGATAITSVQAILYDPSAAPIANVTLGSTTITVLNDPSPVLRLPALRPVVQLAPNPFNPRTRIQFELAEAADVELAVFDPRGRRVAVLHRGPVGAGPFAADWNGLGDNGLPAPAGLYLFRLMPAGDPGWTPVVTKGILLE
jgi:hypothetical protein